MTPQRRILVAGGGLGIGQHVTDTLIHQHNARVIVFGLDVSDAVRQWEKQGQLLVLKGDATKPDSIEDARRKAEEYLGGLDSLVITLGVIWPIDRIDTLDVDAMRRNFEINLFAPLQLARSFLPQLRKNKGSMVVLSSAVDREITWTGWASYCCSKAALTRLIECLGHEEEEVKVLGVYPGLTRTPMVTDLLAGKFTGKMKDWEVEEFKRRDREGEVEPPEWSANTTAKLAAGTIPFPAQGKVLWYNELDSNYKEQK